MYKPLFNQRKALRFRHFSRKGYALFACLGRVVTIGVLSVATLRAAAVTTTDTLSVGGTTVVGDADTNTPDKEATLDDVEVTGSRAPLALGQAARMVTVLSREEIQAAPVQSINDLLKYTVGVDVRRIEVLEGPAGRVFGTSSLVGAINIVTTHAAPKLGEVRRGLNMRLEAGSFGYLSTAGRVGINSHSLSANYTRSDGYQRSASGHLNSDYQGAKAFYQGGYDGEQVQLSWHAGLTTKGFGSNTFYSAKYDEQYEKTTKLYAALQGETHGRLHFKPAIYWNRSYDRFELIRGDESKVPFNHHRTDVFGINLNSYFDWIAGRTAFGAEFRNEDIVSTNLGEPLNEPFSHYKMGLNRSNLSFHLEHNILLSRFTLSAGFLAIKNTWNQMPFTIYPGIDASYRIGNNWKVYVSYNESLRMPSFTELYYSVGGHKADKYLKPEELRAVEGGVKYAGLWLTMKASMFHHHCRNMIDWILDPTEAEPIWKSVNYTKVNTLGVEASATLNLEQLLHIKRSSFNIQYCYMDQDKAGTGDIQTQSTLEYLRHKLVAQLQLHLIAGLDLGVKYRLQKRAGNYTTNAGEVKPYHTYNLVDARLSWNADTYSIYMEANNLFNKKYVDYGNVQQPGTWLTAGVKYNINLW